MAPENSSSSTVSCIVVLLKRFMFTSLRCESAWPGGKAGKRKDAGSTPCLGSPFSSKIVIYGHLSCDFALHKE